jgi:hypothetical protein
LLAQTGISAMHLAGRLAPPRNFIASFRESVKGGK